MATVHSTHYCVLPNTTIKDMSSFLTSDPNIRFEQDGDSLVVDTDSARPDSCACGAIRPRIGGLGPIMSRKASEGRY